MATARGDLAGARSPPDPGRPTAKGMARGAVHGNRLLTWHPVSVRAPRPRAPAARRRAAQAPGGAARGRQEGRGRA